APRSSSSPTARPRRGVTRRTAAAWFADRGWKPFAFQKQVWKAMAEGRSGLLHATTGAGKTYAVWLGALQHLAHAGHGPDAETSASSTPSSVKAEDRASARRTVHEAQAGRSTRQRCSRCTG